MIHNREFELDLVSHSLKKPLYLKQNKVALAKLKFQDPLIDLIYKAVMATVIDNNTVPTMTELQLDLANKMDANERYNFFEKEVVHDTIKAIYERETTDMTGLTISKYLMEKAARELADNLGSDKGDSLISNLAKYEHELAKIKHMFADSEDIGHNVFSADGMDHWKKLLDDYNNAACIPTHYPVLDYCLQGGIRRGELAVILAPTGVGKTSCLLNFTMNFVKNGQRILYIVLDNLEGDMAIRTMGCLLDIDVTQGLNADATIDAARMGYYDQCENNLFYKHFVPKELNKAKLERYLDKFQTHIFEVDKQANVRPPEEWGQLDGLVIDYLDEMSTEYTDNGWETASNLSQEVKAVLKGRNLFGLTATQGGTEAMKSDTIKLHMAQGFKSKFNAPDLIFAISQDDSEKAMNPSVFRLGCLKARRGRSHYQIQFNFWKERQLIREVPNATILTMSSERTTENGAKPVATNNYSSMYGIRDNLNKQLAEQEPGTGDQLEPLGGEEVKSESATETEVSS